MFSNLNTAVKGLGKGVALQYWILPPLSVQLRKKTLLTDLLTCGQKPCSGGLSLGNYDTSARHLSLAHLKPS